MTLNLETLTLDAGAHPNSAAGHCLLEVVSMFAGEPFTAAPSCVAPELAAFGRELNDELGDDQRQALRRFVPMLAGTRDCSGDGSREVRRGLVAADWIVRVELPVWLETLGRADDAATLRNADPVTESTAAAAHEAIADIARDMPDPASRTRRATMPADNVARYSAVGSGLVIAANDLSRLMYHPLVLAERAVLVQQVRPVLLDLSIDLFDTLIATT